MMYIAAIYSMTIIPVYFFDEQEIINENKSEKIKMPWVNFNIKNWYGESAYNIVCFCEVIEHMIESSLRAKKVEEDAK